MKELQEIYQKLMKLHGPQGWWPLAKHYHQNDYSFPRTSRERFEICIGAILTQNTSWNNVEVAIEKLRKDKLLSAKGLLASDEKKVQAAIRPAGYFNQKTKKLKIFAEFYLKKKGKTPQREELLSLWGIGPETADSILLYAYRQEEFVIDAYTKRIFSHFELIPSTLSYDEIKKIFETSLPKNLMIYQEYHALIVEHAKKYYSKKPYGENCPLYIKRKGL